MTGDGTGYRWFYYNNQGLKTAVSNAFGIERNTVFDIDDRGIYVTDSNGVIITNTYDDLGRLQTRTQPNGEAETFGYSARGLIVYTNQLNLTNWYAYDQAGRKIFETNSNNELIRYTNNAAGDLLSLTDGKDQTTRWNYDEYGHVTNKVDQANAEILRYAYAPGGRLTNRWSAAKGNTVYSYDPVANLTNINYPSSTDVRFQYDWLDRVTNMVDAVGTTKYTYTAGGQLASEDGPLPTDTVSNTYTNRLRIALNLQQPTEAWTNAFAYDAARRLTNVTSPAGSFAYQFTAGVPSLLPIKISLPNTAYVTNAYDSLARLAGTYLKNSSHTTLDSYVYVYDPASQRTNLTRTDNSTVAYSYDKIGQLKVANSSVNSEDRGYAYDKAWNLVFRTNNGALSTFFVDNRNQVTNVSAADDYTYDANGNTVGVWGMFTYEYDDENRLTAIEVPEDWRSEFKYDGLGRLRARTEMTTWLAEEGVFVDSIVTYFIYDGYRVVQERVAPNSPSVSYTRGADLSGSLEGARGIGGLLARSDGYSSGNWTTHNFYHADGNGNITYLVNNSQSLAASYRYDPFGKLISSSGSLAGANTYRFSSKEAYDNSGLYYFGYRWYDWNLQRWITRDPIHELGFLSTRGRKAGWHAEAEANLYCFVRNEPNANTDPSGLKKRFFGLTGGTCCNYSGSSEWWLDGQTWKKLKDGDCTGTFDDCDGLTCSGAFYAVPEFGSGQCNGPGSCTTTGPEKQKSVDSPFRTPLEGWTPGSGLGVPPIWDPVRKIGRGASDLPPDYVWIM